MRDVVDTPSHAASERASERETVMPQERMTDVEGT